MKNRIAMIWLSLLTVYCSYTTTDTHAVLKSVRSNQEYTLEYMQKSVNILLKIKHLKVQPDGTLVVPAKDAAEMLADK